MLKKIYNINNGLSAYALTALLCYLTKEEYIKE